MEKSNQTIPNLTPTESGGFEGNVFLAPWVGYASQEMRADGTVSDGNVRLTIGYFNDDNGDRCETVTPEQVAAYDYLTKEADRIRQAILSGLLVYYNESEDIKYFRQGMELAAQIYGPPDSDAEEMLPAITRTEQFKTLIALVAVHIHNVSVDGTAKVGYEFASWDIEHGLGCLLLRDEVLDIGIDAAYFA